MLNQSVGEHSEADIDAPQQLVVSRATTATFSFLVALPSLYIRCIIECVPLLLSLV